MLPTPSTNVAEADPSQVLRRYLTGAAPELRASIGSAVGNAAGGPLGVGHLAEALVRSNDVTARLGRRARAAAAALAESRAQWAPAGRQKFGFPLEELLAAATTAQATTPAAFLATLLDWPGATDERSRAVVAALVELGVTPARVTRPVPLPGDDLVAEAQRHPLASPSAAEQSALARVLTAVRAAEPVAVVGPNGGGKSRLVRRLVKELNGWRVVRLTLGHVARWSAARFRRLFRAAGVDPRVLLVFDPVEPILADATAGPGLAAGLIDTIDARRCSVVLVAGTAGYARHLRSDDGLHSRLRVVQAPVPTPAELPAELSRTAGEWAGKVSVTPSAVKRVKTLTDEWNPTASLRELVGVLTEAARTRTGEAGDLTDADIDRAFAARVGVPLEDIAGEPTERFERLRRSLASKIRGQDGAINGVIEHLLRRWCGVGDPRRPRGRFLFLGPPGVGKTELALRLAEELFRDPTAVWQQNLGGLPRSAAAYAFRGAPAGHIGYGDPTVFTHLETQPLSVVVLDELDKSPKSLAGCLLDTLDGRVKDARGRDVDARNAVFCFTTNALAGELTADMPEGEVRSRLADFGRAFTAPLLDRLDRVLVFAPLDEPTLRQIAADKLNDQLARIARQMPEQEVSALADELAADAARGHGASSVRRLEAAAADRLARRFHL